VIAELRRRQELQQLQEQRRRQLLAAQQRQQRAAAVDEDADDPNSQEDPQARAVSDALAAAVQRCASWRDLVPLAQRYGNALAEDARALTLAWRLFERSARASPPRTRGEAEAAAALEEWLRARVLEAAEGARQRLAAAEAAKQQQQNGGDNGRRMREEEEEGERRRRRQQQAAAAAAAQEEQQRRQQILEQQQQQLRRRREQEAAAAAAAAAAAEEEQEQQRQRQLQQQRAAALEAAEAQRRRAQAQRQAQEEEVRRSALQRQRERALAVQKQQQQRPKQQQPQQQRRPPPMPPSLKTLGTKTNLPALKAAAKALSNPTPSRATLSGCVAALEAAMDDERERAATARAKAMAAAASAANAENDDDPAAVAALRRLRSDFDNFRARSEREKDQEYGKAAQDACVALCFPLLDAFDAAEASTPAKTGGERRVVAEYSTLRDQLLRTLKDVWGVVRVSEARVGEPFDPLTMEAIARDAVSEGGAADGCVSRVFRAGYRAVSGDSDSEPPRLLRPAMVAVASDEV
jgi:molecular chaperone GrpE (heat shock protein)